MTCSESWLTTATDLRGGAAWSRFAVVAIRCSNRAIYSLFFWFSIERASACCNDELYIDNKFDNSAADSSTWVVSSCTLRFRAVESFEILSERDNFSWHAASSLINSKFFCSTSATCCTARCCSAHLPCNTLRSSSNAPFSILAASELLRHSLVISVTSLSRRAMRFRISAAWARASLLYDFSSSTPILSTTDCKALFSLFNRSASARALLYCDSSSKISADCRSIQSSRSLTFPRVKLNSFLTAPSSSANVELAAFILETGDGNRKSQLVWSSDGTFCVPLGSTVHHDNPLCTSISTKALPPRSVPGTIISLASPPFRLGEEATTDSTRASISVSTSGFSPVLFLHSASAIEASFKTVFKSSIYSALFRNFLWIVALSVNKSASRTAEA